MFWSVPISDTETITNTPIGVKSITHVFFEDKNGGIFDYDPDGLQTISLSIGGKQILQDVPVLPFCTSTPDNINRFKWQDVALEVNMNVAFSEVKISGARTANDFSVVFVTSTSETDATLGFDYVEFEQYNIRNSETSTLLKRAKSVFDAARSNARKWVEASSNASFHTLWLSYAKGYAAKAKTYISSLAKKWSSVTDTSAQVPDEPTTTYEVDSIQALATAAYKAADTEAMLPANRPKEITDYVTDEGKVFPDDYTKATINTQWKTYAAAHAAHVVSYINSLSYQEAYSADDVITAPTTLAQVNSNVELANNAYDEEDTEYQNEERPSVLQYTPGTNKSKVFPDGYTDWANAGNTTGLTPPDDSVNYVWNITVCSYTDTSTGALTACTKKYEYLKDETCKFADTPDDTAYYSYGDKYYTTTYAQSWINYDGTTAQQDWGMTEDSAYSLILNYGLRNLQADFGTEQTIKLQSAPARVFALSVASGATGQTEPQAKTHTWLLPCDIRLNFSLSSDIQQVFPPNTDIELIQITQGVPYASAAFDFESGSVSKSIRFSYNLTTHRRNGSISLSDTSYSKIYGSNLENLKAWDLFIFFVYKKIA